MMRTLIVPSVTCFLFAILAVSSPADTPEGALLEAEDQPNASQYGQVVEDADASGGQAVTSGQEWRPVFRHTLGDDVPAKVKVYVRHKGGPLQLKSKIEGKNKEHKWLWDKPDAYTWSSFGTYSREQLGESIEIIRGKGDAGPRVDAVVLADAAAGAAPQNINVPQNAGDAGIDGEAATGGDQIPPYEPRADLEPINATLSVDWSADHGTLTDKHWGIALFHPVRGRAADDQAYIDFLTLAQPGVMRIHRAGLGEAWMNQKKKRLTTASPSGM